MLIIDGIKVKKGMTFTSKESPRKRFVVSAIHRNETISYAPEASMLLERRISFSEFENNTLKKWVESKADAAIRLKNELSERAARITALHDDLEEAFLTNIVFDAQHGVDAGAILERLKDLIEEEKSSSRSYGFDEGVREAESSNAVGYGCSYCLDASRPGCSFCI